VEAINIGEGNILVHPLLPDVIDWDALAAEPDESSPVQAIQHPHAFPNVSIDITRYMLKQSKGDECNELDAANARADAAERRVIELEQELAKLKAKLAQISKLAAEQ
jgi:hypothetical protein